MAKIQITIDDGINRQLQELPSMQNNEKSLFVNACLSLGLENLGLIRTKMQELINKKTNNLLGASTHKVETTIKTVSLKDHNQTVQEFVEYKPPQTNLHELSALKKITNETKFIDDDEFGDNYGKNQN